MDLNIVILIASLTMLYFGFIQLGQAIKERNHDNKNNKNWTILQINGIKCQQDNMLVY